MPRIKKPHLVGPYSLYHLRHNAKFNCRRVATSDLQIFLASARQ